MTAVAHINAVGTANPPYEVHDAFVAFVTSTLDDPKARRLFERMVGRAGIERRYSFLEPVCLADGTVTDTADFYGVGEWPSTGQRMLRYERDAPTLAMEAIERIGAAFDPTAVTHLVVASCTGFMAPGLDQIIVDRLGLSPGVERSLLGFMGCYAAVNALRTAHHIVRSTPAARVLVVTLELCSLHFQRSDDLERLLAMLLFGDGAAAALVTADAQGIALEDFRATTIAGSADAISWRIGDQGFDMHLGGEVPARISEALRLDMARGDASGLLRGQAPGAFELWAVHAGGRSILDAVQHALGLAPDALDRSRSVLRDYGNMSSATLMFVLADVLRDRPADMGAGAAPLKGLAMAFGPGLAAESFPFSLLP